MFMNTDILTINVLDVKNRNRTVLSAELGQLRPSKCQEFNQDPIMWNSLGFSL